ncbi:GNAT family N-acetyltransferase [Nocardioides sp. Kera G14]|uniref:GNAT family N-acetyltransferase n=1 Tax=Nocardioides sp. Kera G14 TaxID=2884264 RepID=UPI001D117986|nr:GNAT family N-acetyltransferase [Nocardioides sp. Kera G14]UDY23577.1 GNAT family N-acetyltransferase [Nocardioides sp. Kera G14]
MARKVVPLTLDLFEELGAPCRSCLFWELDPVRRAQLDGDGAATEKDAWISEVLREWGSCGRVAVVDDRPVGYVVYVPPAFAPGAGAYPTAPVSPDAVLLTTLWIAPGWRDAGIGRLLIQGMARDLLQRGGSIRAVEAFGDKGLASRLHGSRCAAPEQFLARVGFKTHRAHPTAPRMRMDLRSIVTWRDGVEAAVERLVGVVRPRKAPMPQHRGVPGHREALE